MTPLAFSLSIAILTVIFYLVVGFSSDSKNKDWDTFFLNKRKLTARGYSSSFAAASTSLATVFVFFIVSGKIEGLAIIIAPITYYLGALLFSKIAEKMGAAGFVKNGNTMAGFIGGLYGSRLVSLAIALIGLSGVMSILLIELYVGSEILGQFFSPDGGSDIYVMPIICFVVFLYVMSGGFSAVIKTDKIQLAMMYICVIAILAWLFLGDSKELDPKFIPNEVLSGNRFLLPLALLLNLIFVNFLLLPAQIRSWQMAAASRSVAELRKGIVSGAYKTIVLWIMIILIGIYLPIEFSGELSLKQMFDYLSVEEKSFVPNYIILPILFSAATAALLSTADSALVPMLHLVVYDLLPAKIRDSEKQQKKTLTVLSFSVLSIVMLLFFFVTRSNYFDWQFLLFTVFGIFIVTTPVILGGLYFPEYAATKIGKNTALISLAAGSTANLIAVYSGAVRHSGTIDGLSITQMAGPIGLATSSALVLVGIISHKFSNNMVGGKKIGRTA